MAQTADCIPSNLITFDFDIQIVRKQFWDFWTRQFSFLQCKMKHKIFCVAKNFVYNWDCLLGDDGGNSHFSNVWFCVLHKLPPEHQQTINGNQAWRRGVRFSKPRHTTRQPGKSRGKIFLHLDKVKLIDVSLHGLVIRAYSPLVKCSLIVHCWLI